MEVIIRKEVAKFIRSELHKRRNSERHRCGFGRVIMFHVYKMWVKNKGVPCWIHIEEM